MAPPQKLQVLINDIIDKRLKKEKMSPEMFREMIIDEVQDKCLNINDLVVHLTADIKGHVDSYLQTHIELNDKLIVTGIADANKYSSGLISLLPDNEMDEYIRRSFKGITRFTLDELIAEENHNNILITHLKARTNKVKSVLQFKSNKSHTIKREILEICKEEIEENRKRMFSELSQSQEIQEDDLY
jgi:hypothetical protein